MKTHWIVALLVMLAAGCNRQGSSPPPETAIFRETDAQRFEREALEKMTNFCKEEIVGFSRIVHSSLMSFDPAPPNWTGSASVDYVNHLGGIDRTNIEFHFLLDTNEFRHYRVQVEIDHMFWSMQAAKAEAAAARAEQ